MNRNDVIMSYVGEGKMKINPSKITSIYEAQSRCNIKNQNVAASEEAPNRKGDRIEISQKGLRYGEILASKTALVKELEKGAKQEKIQMLKEKISKGEYNVSSHDIAEAILKKSNS